ncbi:MAG: DNA alkylation repair protein [Chitinophagaceae bacterium]|nr:DNA alkylation repair protein [Chitinophagaceae bacterium]
MSHQLKEIQKILAQKGNTGNAAFFEKMVPGRQKIYGVKTPELNGLARLYRPYSFQLAKELWNAGALEEKIIAIKIIEKTGKNEPAMVLKLFKEFSKKIDNWAVCDGLGMQFLRGIVKTHDKEIFAMAGQLSRSKDPWQRRLSLVMVEWYTRHSDKHTAVRSLVRALEKDDEYYVKKAVTWIKRNFSKNK